MTQMTKVQEMTALLEEGVQSVYTSDAWRELLTFQSRFHRYSFQNMALIFFQRPDATQIAGIHDWNKLGRYVNKGEHGLKIWAPTMKREVDEETGEIKYKRAGYHLTTVFDVSQTNGKELPSLTMELTMDTATLRNFYDKLKSVCPFPLEEKKIDGGAKGYFDYATQSIAIKKGMAALQKCKTLVHEMAHGMLHSGDTDKSRDIREVEAEGTAFVVLSYFGFDTSEYSFPYVAGWQGTVESGTIKTVGHTIQQAAAKIIDRIEQFQNEEQAA